MTQLHIYVYSTNIRHFYHTSFPLLNIDSTFASVTTLITPSWTITIISYVHLVVKPFYLHYISTTIHTSCASIHVACRLQY